MYKTAPDEVRKRWKERYPEDAEFFIESIESFE